MLTVPEEIHTPFTQLKVTPASAGIGTSLQVEAGPINLSQSCFKEISNMTKRGMVNSTRAGAGGDGCRGRNEWARAIDDLWVGALGATAERLHRAIAIAR